MVRTPSTDRCLLALFAAQHSGSSCVVTGPAGVGKTETVKELCKAVAVPCIVFGCTPGVVTGATGRWLKGLGSDRRVGMPRGR